MLETVIQTSDLVIEILIVEHLHIKCQSVYVERGCFHRTQKLCLGGWASVCQNGLPLSVAKILNSVR